MRNIKWKFKLKISAPDRQEHEIYIVGGLGGDWEVDGETFTSAALTRAVVAPIAEWMEDSERKAEEQMRQDLADIAMEEQ